MPASPPAAADYATPNGHVMGGVFYPSSDGKPMAENTWQLWAMVNALGDLEEALREPSWRRTFWCTRRRGAALITP